MAALLSTIALMPNALRVRAGLPDLRRELLLVSYSASHSRSQARCVILLEHNHYRGATQDGVRHVGHRTFCPFRVRVLLSAQA